MATMSDVAKRAGVSLSTVSYAISGTRPISDATRERVFQAMRELDFTPNAVAQGLASRRTRILGLLLPIDETRLDVFTADIVVGAAEAARNTGHHLLLWTEPEDESTSIRELLRQGLVDGALVLSVRMKDDRIDILRSDGVPLTMVGHPGGPESLPYVDTDAAQTTELAVAHLGELGHRNVAWIAPHRAGPQEGYGIGIRLHDGLLDAGVRHGVHLRSLFVDPTKEAAAESVAALLDAEPQVTGVVALHDQVISGVLTGVAALGRSVPEDVSVVGLMVPDQVATLMMPPVTTVGPDPAELGRRGAMLLIDYLSSSDHPVGQELLSSALVRRSTTAAAPLSR